MYNCAMKARTAILAAAVAAAAALSAVLAVRKGPSADPGDGEAEVAAEAVSGAAGEEASGPDAREEGAGEEGKEESEEEGGNDDPAQEESDGGEDADEEEDAPPTEEELREREEEALVEAFDAMTDKWMEPSKRDVSMKDIDDFAAQFRKVPESRREECLQRALNLVPDENVMLLAGILMDKSQDKDLVELVYNDVLNRDEDVKKPILMQIFKDRTHPCWADTAWILDATGELPGEK